MSTKKRNRTSRRKGIYLLPNLFTSASLFGGFYAIIASMQDRYEAAAIAILVSALFDGLDGRVARFTHTTSDFGVEYDSLSDLIAFGVAPGILAFKWALAPYGRLGWLAAFMYVICGALRLARFNIQKSVVEPNYFRGLPIPAAASLVSSWVLFANEMGGILQSKPFMALTLIYILSFLMVSTIRYLSFKKFDIRHRKPFNMLVSVILVGIVIAYRPTFMLFLITLAYTISGPAMTLFRLSRRRVRAGRGVVREGPERVIPVTGSPGGDRGIDYTDTPGGSNPEGR
ncbi:MAG: CDP-diacylglycerol--serine O-phosphatidyltransferase [Deltaproteobacteria bacterium]|nr:CDP-diacylglycerol--serine O-phosphatidyltransferase [Deltaproteobacteria bacterium]